MDGAGGGPVGVVLMKSQRLRAVDLVNKLSLALNAALEEAAYHGVQIEFELDRVAVANCSFYEIRQLDITVWNLGGSPTVRSVRVRHRR